MKPDSTKVRALETEAEMAELGAQVQMLLRRAPSGVFATVSSQGHPQIRWMATSTFEEFPLLYTLTSAQSRKAQDLAIHPEVTWMFTAEDMKFVVNLFGRARIVEMDPATIKKIWHQIEDKSRAYFLGHCVSGPGFSILETMVERVECTFPDRDETICLDPKWVHEAKPEVAAPSQ